jgi:hypothetical protein
MHVVDQKASNVIVGRRKVTPLEVHISESAYYTCYDFKLAENPPDVLIIVSHIPCERYDKGMEFKRRRALKRTPGLTASADKVQMQQGDR